MGLGAGIGDKFGRVNCLLYYVGIIGLGGVICLDALVKTIYVQYTFTFPYYYMYYLVLLDYDVSYRF